ncbi:hypothetical protein [Streptomyces sp. H27-C3]|uniref:hypothetical protein n=1 Tax=Streptomyces sp. H27-C3 TaxID=3046305 RepID=UPI0024B98B0F|nr:hypothetical protein [Streptomyces sp. H27-C3]MDJ0463127.1 hypothetical protein [Streptomyces sp. H27-C3]
MRELTSLLHPKTPFGAEQRPFGHKMHLLTGMACQWAEVDGDPVLVTAGAVFMPVHRTKERLIEPDVVQFGYRLAVSEQPGDNGAMLRFIDGILVQARRHSAGIAWHSFQDDLHVMLTLATERLPGIIGVGEAWQDREHRERGVVPMIDTAADAHFDGLLPEAMGLQGLEVSAALHTYQHPSTVQTIAMELFAEETRERAVEELGAGTLTSAAAVSLLGGKLLGRLTWDKGFDLGHVVDNVAWDRFPSIFTNNTSPSQ